MQCQHYYGAIIQSWYAVKVFKVCNLCKNTRIQEYKDTRISRSKNTKDTSIEKAKESEVQQVNVAVIGCGYWGPNLIRNLQDDPRVKLSHVCDKVDERLAQLRRRYPTINFTTDYGEVLDDPDVQAVVIATPVNTHFSLAREALLASKHVLIEKPMCTTAEQCKDLIKLGRDVNRHVMVDHTFVYNPSIRRIKEILDRGELGEILYFNSTRVNLGIVQNDVNVVWDLASHDLAIMDYLLGVTPTSIHAAGGSHIRKGLQDIAYITLTFEADLIAHFHVSWLSPVKVRQITIGGRKKMIVFNDLVITEKVRVYDKGISIEQPQTDQERYESLISYRKGDMYAPVVDTTEPLKLLTGHFIDCIVDGKTPLTDGEAGLRVVNMLQMADASFRSGNPHVVAAGKN